LGGSGQFPFRIPALEKPSLSVSTPSFSALQAHLQSGKVVVLPTDTVAGLAVLGGSQEALAKLTEIKGGPPRPFTLHFSSKAHLKEYFPKLPPGLAGLLCRKLPGPYTFLIPRSWANLPKNWKWPWELVGVRIPDCPDFLKFAGNLDLPICATSANRHNESPLKGNALKSRFSSMEGILFMKGAEKVTGQQSSAVISLESDLQILRGEVDVPSFLPGSRILILCTGNICRSPFAEVLLRREIAQAWEVEESKLAALGWKVGSAGIFALQGGPATSHSIQVAREEDLDLSQHRSQPLAAAFESDWDLVLGMGPNHMVELPRNVKRELIDLSGSPVPDPYGGTLEDYQSMARKLAGAIAARIKAWAVWPEV